MDDIYAPWRGEYIRQKEPDGCVFCKGSLRKNEFVLYEGQAVFVMMNRYPYSCGHLLIIPVRHVGQLHELEAQERVEMFNLMDLSVKVIKETMFPDGFNLGINLGRVAGAGVEGHIHIHAVPRWNGDTNFMTVIGQTRVLSEDMFKIRDDLLSCFKRLTHQEG